ncbi:MAG: hypothetical protein DRP30_07535 [Thermotoga sp.]|nr:MAG: hypothetical protein DRP30_07535 [Thermotoga sp.]
MYNEIRQAIKEVLEASGFENVFMRMVDPREEIYFPAYPVVVSESELINAIGALEEEVLTVNVGVIRKGIIAKADEVENEGLNDLEKIVGLFARTIGLDGLVVRLTPVGIDIDRVNDVERGEYYFIGNVKIEASFRR